MPSVRERRFTALSEGSPQSIGSRLADLQPSRGCGYLPRVTRLHLSHQLDVGHVALLFIHIFVSRKEAFMLT